VDATPGWGWPSGRMPVGCDARGGDGWENVFIRTLIVRTLTDTETIGAKKNAMLEIVMVRSIEKESGSGQMLVLGSWSISLKPMMAVPCIVRFSIVVGVT